MKIVIIWRNYHRKFGSFSNFDAKSYISRNIGRILRIKFIVKKKKPLILINHSLYNHKIKGGEG